MAKINTLEIPDELYTQIQDIAVAQSRPINDEILVLLQLGLRQATDHQPQPSRLQIIGQSQWNPTTPIPDSVAILREIRGYDE